MTSTSHIGLIIDRLALSETQMGIEKASVQSAKLFGDITGEQLMKHGTL